MDLWSQYSYSEVGGRRREIAWKLTGQLVSGVQWTSTARELPQQGRRGASTPESCPLISTLRPWLERVAGGHFFLVCSSTQKRSTKYIYLYIFILFLDYSARTEFPPFLYLEILETHAIKDMLLILAHCLGFTTRMGRFLIKTVYSG